MPQLQLLKDEQGKITYKFRELTKLLQEAWQGVYQGNVMNLIDSIQQFLAKYQHEIYRASEDEIQDVAAEDLQQTCLRALLLQLSW